jgi:NAD(P)-dependent dehydrogenase (short-subunit alcohol dehydrogenase family)
LATLLNKTLTRYLQIFDLNEDGANRLARELGKDRVLAPGKVDVTQEVRRCNKIILELATHVNHDVQCFQDDVAQALEMAVKHFGSLAGAIICHGILGAPASITGYGPGNALTSFDQIKYVGKVNFLGAYNVAQKVADILIKQEPLSDEGERGVIIMVTSIAGLDGSILAYGTSKGKE